MAKKEQTPGLELDADGLVVQRYISTVLVVVPPTGFGEQTLRGARSSLYNVRVGSRTVSTLSDEMVRGRLQDEFLVDGSIRGESLESYSGVIFAGGESDAQLEGDEDCLRLAREAAATGKLLAAYGNAVAVLARAGVIRGLRVTGPPALADVVKRAGGHYTGRQIETSGKVVTGIDEAVAMRFGKALAQVVAVR
jgi:putative intracellular protease/amidase